MSQNPLGETPAIVDALAQLSFAVQAVLVRAAAAHNLSLIQLRMLGVLRDRTAGMMELARTLGLDKSSVTGLVDRAEKRGLVERSTIPEDGRAIRVSVTAQGYAIGSELAAQVTQEIGELVSVLSEAEREQLTELAFRLLSQ